MEAPDVVDAKLREVVHQVDVEVDPDVHVGYDMPMSIYSPYNFYHFFVIASIKVQVKDKAGI
jgi:hypothetical protein